MNVADCSVAVNGNGYELRKASFADSKFFDNVLSFERVSDSPPIPSNSQSETYHNPQDDYRMGSTYMQVDSQRDNFLQEYVKEEEEEEEDKKDDKLVDYLLEALRGKEKELRMEGNSYTDDEDRKKYLRERHCPDLFANLY